MTGKITYQRTQAGLIALRGSEIVDAIPRTQSFALFMSIAPDGSGDIHKHGAAADVKPIYVSTTGARERLRLRTDQFSYHEIPVADLNDDMVDEINRAISSPDRIFLVPALAQALSQLRQPIA